MRCDYRFFIVLLIVLPLAAQAQQPFGIKVQTLTLSNGYYPEFFTNDSLRRIGSVIYDTRRQRIAYLLPPDSLSGHPHPEVVSRWLSVDPMASRFAYESPYTYVNNTPINKVDPDGQTGIATLDKQSHTVTVSSHIYFYGQAGSEELAQKVANNIQTQWNAAKGNVTINGVVYAVKFVVTGEYKPNLSAEEVRDNTNYENNYVLFQATRPVYYEHSHFGEGDNIGVFWVKEMNDDSNTATHEYGHGLQGISATYYGRKLIKGHPVGANGVEGFGMGIGRPGIMFPRGSTVDSEYAIPNFGNWLDPKQRAVNQADIDFLGLDKLNYDENGKANVGQTLPQYQTMPSDPAKTASTEKK